MKTGIDWFEIFGQKFSALFYEIFDFESFGQVSKCLSEINVRILSYPLYIEAWKNNLLDGDTVLSIALIYIKLPKYFRLWSSEASF